MPEIQSTLEASLEDYAISRSERKELKALFESIHRNTSEQAKARQLAFRLATKIIGEIGEIAAMEWLQSVIKLLYASETEIKSEAFFSPGEDCLHRIRRFITEAQTTLDICVFTITDNRISDRIKEAHSRGVKVRIISDDMKSDDLGSDLAHLQSFGINCLYDKTSAHMHHKFAIADGIKLLNGSYNWTRSASAENNENITVTNHPTTIGNFQQQFDRLWKALA